MRKSIYILSDINGSLLSAHKSFLDQWAEEFDVKVLDSRQLAEISLDIKNQDYVHHRFINGGIKKATTNLIKRINPNSYVIGFSIGGTIAWHAAKESRLIDYFMAVSATRLRYEETKPNSPMTLIYGAQDEYAPQSLWFDTMEIVPIIYPSEGHLLYLTSLLDEIISIFGKQIKGVTKI